MRTFLTIVLPLIAPTIVFFVWSWFQARRARAEARHEPIPAWQTWPWGRLVLTGAVLAILTLSTFALLREGGPGMQYVPPHMEDGELVPGQFVPADEAPESGSSYQGLGEGPPSLPNQQPGRGQGAGE